MNVIFGLAEKGFVVVSLLMFTEALIPVIREASGMAVDQGDPITQLLNLGILLGNVLMFAVWYKRILRTVLKEKLLWLLLAIAVVSLLWSSTPGATLSRAIALIRTTGFGVYFAARYTLKEQLRLLAWTFGIAAVLSLVFAVALPSYGQMGKGSVMTAEAIAHAGKWRGVYLHKNSLGRIMVLSGLVFSLLASSSRRYRWVGWGGFALSVILLLGSTSKSALIILLTLIALLPLYRALRWNYTFAIPFFIATILIGAGLAIVLVGNAEAILGAFGRDLTLTGRTELWAAVLDKVWEHPWLGYGYNGFWQGLQGESADIWNIVGWQAPHSHNGFLDLWIDLGLLGLSVFAIGFITVCFRAVTLIRRVKTAEALLPLSYLTFWVLSNLTESSLVRPNFFWLLYVVVALSVQSNKENLATPHEIWQQNEKGEVMSYKKTGGRNASSYPTQFQQF